MSDAALQNYLAPLRAFLDDEAVEEIILNQPGEVFVERAGQWTRHPVPPLDQRRLFQMAELAATYTHQRVSAGTPLLSAYLPGGERLQIVMPPACPAGTFGFAIRKPTTRTLSLEELSKRGSLTLARASLGRGQPDVSTADAQLTRLLRAGQVEELLRLAVQSKRNIIISGGTSTGKTTVLRALTQEFDPTERIITIEDVREIQLAQPNRLHLLASKGNQGVGNVTFASLLEACLRLRPDRILLGEMRGVEAADFLELVNTGHPGSISTVHADSPRLCFERLAFMVKRREGFQSLQHSDLISYIKSVVDLVVQFKRFDGGARGVTDIWMAPRITGLPEEDTGPAV